MSDAEQVLTKCLEKILDEIGYAEKEIEIKPFNSGASNFTTVLFGVIVTSHGKETLNLFAKVSMIGEKMREQMNASLFYDSEYRFYTKVVPVFQEFYTNYNVPDEDRIIFPKFYGGSMEKGEEVIILENLMSIKYTLFDRKKSVDWEHAAVSIKNLARFHALGFALKKQDPDMFAEVANNTYMKEVMEKLEPQAERMMAELIQLVAEEFRAKAGAIMADKDLTAKTLDGSLGSGCTTLIHGDYRTSNLMYKRQKGKIISMPVDFQTLKEGNVFVDLFYFIFLNTDEQFRKYYWTRLIEYYYTELTNSLRKLKLDVKEIYPKESFDNDLKTYLPTNIMVVLMVLPLVLVDTSVAPDFSANDAGFDEFSVPPNEYSIERINGVMRDLAKMGVF